MLKFVGNTFSGMSGKKPPSEGKENKVKLTRKERQELAKAKLEKKGLPVVGSTGESKVATNKLSSSSGDTVKNLSVKKDATSKPQPGGDGSKHDTQSPAKQIRASRLERLESSMENFDKIIQYFENKKIILHPMILKVGLQMNQGIIRGSAKRCIAMLVALKSMIKDLEIPARKDFMHTFQSNLDASVRFLEQCRQLSVSMTNAIRYLKTNSTKIPPNQSEMQCREFVDQLIEKYLSEYQLAMKAIVRDGASKISDSDEVILTYGDSLLVRNLLMKAHSDGKKFRVIVVDSRPRSLGRPLIEYLVSHKIPVTYTPINAIAYVMKEVTKVVIGAHAVLANGYVMASLGTSQIALVSQAFNVPISVCCETLNFSEKAHIDSFVFNEEGPKEDFFVDIDPEKSKLEQFMNTLEESKSSTSLAKTSGPISPPKDKTSEGPKKKHHLDIWNYFYDFTPPSLISLVITEKGFLPCSSVSAVIRKNYGRF